MTAILMGFYGALWDFNGFYGILWDFMGFYGGFMGFKMIYPLVMTNSLRHRKWPSRNSEFSPHSMVDLSIVMGQFTRG